MADLFETIGDWLGLNKGKATQKAAEQNRGVIDQLAKTGRPIIEGIQGVTGDYLDLGKLGADRYADAMGSTAPTAMPGPRRRSAPGRATSSPSTRGSMRWPARARLWAGSIAAIPIST
jgi:hypothetical protein